MKKMSEMTGCENRICDEADPGCYDCEVLQNSVPHHGLPLLEEVTRAREGFDACVEIDACAEHSNRCKTCGQFCDEPQDTLCQNCYDKENRDTANK